MAQYCDSKSLESHWFKWLIAEPTPSLNDYRSSGKLLSKVIKSEPADPSPAKYDAFWGYSQSQHREHCVHLNGQPIYFRTTQDIITTPPYKIENGKCVECQLPPPTEADKIILLKNIPNGYITEEPIHQSWHKLSIEVFKICSGIVVKFNQKTEEEKSDLENELFTEVMKKIKAKKIIYTPGRAPVFNLLTTTIYRIGYSVMNRRNIQKKHMANYVKAKKEMLVG